MDTLSLLRSGALAGCKRLDLSCDLTEFPEEIYDLADTLEVLNLSGNRLESLPHDLPRLRKLRVIFCSDNRFTHVPEVLGECTALEMLGFKSNRVETLPAASLPQRLRWLILTDNRLSSLPDALGARPRLQKLMLAGNDLSALPNEMAACLNLELLRLSANRIEHLPSWLLALPRLSWLAFSGNGLQSERLSTEALHVHWDDLVLQHKLGEGASGIIHQGIWHTPEGGRDVAVKLFKGAVTSDGLPANEKALCIASGSHPNLISTSGKIIAHPEGVAGLVMPLVDASFKNLAGPPSLESCTRDIYADELRFSPEQMLSIAQGIASAAAHLHGRGIMHGDLYAHNILWNELGESLLGDFGAASFSGKDAYACERIEVRAFGCLLDELLVRCEDAPPVLSALQQSCVQPDVQARPAFIEIEASLEALADV